jgi:hypothetical protein
MEGAGHMMNKLALSRLIHRGEFSSFIVRLYSEKIRTVERMSTWQRNTKRLLVALLSISFAPLSLITTDGEVTSLVDLAISGSV